jgi:ABC-2 type transport system ATP-binding protein
MTPLLSIESVEKSFDSVRAVSGVSFDVQPGELIALLGPNGAGKTTLVRMIIGMLRPDRGRIIYRLNGGEAGTGDPTRIGYLPEERGMYTDVPVLRSVVYFAALRGMPRREAQRAAQRWLERLGIADRSGDEVRNLSKGNQQKVQFISSIVHQPTLAVLDEPFSGLDPLNQDLFLDLILELRAAGTTVLFSAHQMQLVERLADRVVLMRNGRAVSAGTIDDLRVRWGAGRRLRVRLSGDADLTPLDRMPEVHGVRRVSEANWELVLQNDAAYSNVLRAIAAFDVLDLHTEAVSLHDIYVRSISGDAGGEMTL